MESSTPRQGTTLASIIDADKVIAPPRARALLATLAKAKSVPEAPATVREWSEAVVVERDAAGAERAVFAGVPAVAADRGAGVMRHIDALRAAAVAMLWGRESVLGPDGQPRFSRLRKLLVENWDDTRGSCDGADKLMMFFDATLALDRAAESKVGREAFKTLSLPSLDAVKKDKLVGTIGIPFEAIIDTGKFKKAARPGAAQPEPAAKQNQGPKPTPPVPSAAQPASPRPTPTASEPQKRSMVPLIAGIVAGVVLVALALILLGR